MGNCAHADGEFDPTVALTLDSFELKYPVGLGGYGRVWKVLHKSSGLVFAMKEMRKDLIVEKKSVLPIMNERNLLGLLKHPFIVNLHYAFQNKQNLYLVIDFMPGGDLRYYYSTHPQLSEAKIRFIAACIVAGLEYLHGNDIVHRDLKPENLVIDEKGYVRITDFGIARKGSTDNSAVISGTPGYMAPEMICSQDHTTVADYFALGVIVYEAMLGCRPYNGKNRKEIRDAILQKQVVLREEHFPQWSKEALDFVNRLIKRKPEQRLGCFGIEEIKRHPWFEGFQWETLYEKKAEETLKVEEIMNFDQEQVRQKFRSAKMKISDVNSQKLFAGFYYDYSLISGIGKGKAQGKK
jgi:serine/threonine protein kinase